MKRRISVAGATSATYALNPAYIDPTFSAAVIEWQQQHGRHALPWQLSRAAYRVWLSEIMLQQTQVAAVIPYYQRFLERFPTVHDLAAAPSEDVMAHWAGLGYYTRARNLHQCAKQVVELYQGEFPSDPRLLQELPGIGRSTAAAIAAFSYGTVAAILDGNVKRVFARVFGIAGYPGIKTIEDNLWLRAQALLPASGIESYTQGLMDLGATLCTRSSPSCQRCPLQERCVAYKEGRTTELPTRKPKKEQKEKSAMMLVLRHEQQILLERRPETGIWGGLLSLPELDGMQEGVHAANVWEARQDAVLSQASVFGDVAECMALPAFEHVFTHFRLHVQPVQVRLSCVYPLVAEQRYVWSSLVQMKQAGLPAPVKNLLLALDSEAVQQNLAFGSE